MIFFVNRFATMGFKVAALAALLATARAAATTLNPAPISLKCGMPEATEEFRNASMSLQKRDFDMVLGRRQAPGSNVVNIYVHVIHTTNHQGSSKNGYLTVCPNRHPRQD